MKWGLRDTMAYNATTDAGERIRKAMEQYQAGKAYKEGSEVTAPDADAARIGGLMQSEIMAPNPTTDDEGNPLPAGSVIPSRSGIDVSGMSEADRRSAANAYGKYAADNSKWKMGGQEYDAVPTRMEKHRAGLMSQAEKLFSTGRMEEAGRLLERASAIEDSEQRRKAMGLDITGKERQLADHKLATEAGAEYREAMKDPFKFLKWQYDGNRAWAGQGEHANQKVQYEKLPGGNAMIWFEDKDGNRVSDSTKIFTPKEAKSMVSDAYFDRLSSLSPEYAFKNADRVEKNAHQTRVEDLEEKKIDSLERARTETNALTRQHYKDMAARYAAESSKWQMMYGDKNDLTKYALGQQKKFDEEKGKIVERMGLDSKDPKFLTRENAARELEFAQLKFGTGHGPTVPKQAPITMEKYGTLFPPGPKETDEAFKRRYANFIMEAGNGPRGNATAAALTDRSKKPTAAVTAGPARGLGSVIDADPSRERTAGRSLMLGADDAVRRAANAVPAGYRINPETGELEVDQ